MGFKMESRFPQRVALERRVLDAINSSLVAEPLVGLSYKTIKSWLAKLRSSRNAGDLSELEVAVLLCAEAARSQADISDEIFVDIDEAEAASALERLNRALLSVSRPS